MTTQQTKPAAVQIDEARPTKSKWYVETAGEYRIVQTTTAKAAATIAIITAYNAGQPVGKVVSVSRHGFGSEAPDDMFYLTENLIAGITQHPADEPGNKLSHVTRQQLIDFPFAFIAQWESLWRDRANPALPMAHLYRQAIALVDQIKAAQ